MSAPMNGTHKPEILSRPRARREAAKVLGLAIQQRYRRLLEATGEDEIVMATGDLAQVMYENVEFTIWALKTIGGLNPPPPDTLKPISKQPLPPANDPLAEDLGARVCNVCGKGPGHAAECEKLKPAPVLDLPCTCPPLEHGILFRDRHMTSCPKFVP